MQRPTMWVSIISYTHCNCNNVDVHIKYIHLLYLSIVYHIVMLVI